MRRGYHPNHSEVDGLGGFMMSPGFAKVPLQAARDIARRAGMLVRADSKASGDDDGESLASNYKVVPNVVTLNDAGHPNPRHAALVVNDARHAARWEFGAAPGHRNAHRSLRRAGASVGELKGEIG